MSLAIDPDNPNFRIDKEQLALVEKKERENRNVGGMTSSWTSSPDTLDPSLIPEDKRKLLEKSQLDHPPLPESAIPIRSLHAPYSKSILVTVPKQAMKSFKELLNLFEAVQVNLTTEQSKMFLKSLEAMPTPKKMVDAQAIVLLMQALL